MSAAEAAAFLQGFWVVAVGFTIGAGLLAWTVRLGSDEQARRERIWTLELSPRGLARLAGWVLTIGAVWRVVGYLADRRPVEFLAAAAVLLLLAQGVGRLKRATMP